MRPSPPPPPSRNMKAYQPRENVELDSEKSKQGLGDIYADEFAKQASNKTATAAEEKLEQQHVRPRGPHIRPRL